MSTDKALLQEIDDVKKLIKESDKIIKDKKHNKVLEYAALIAGGLFVPGMPVLAATALTVMAIDDISLTLSQKRANNKLQAYYNELAVKQNLLIDEQQKNYFYLVQ